MVQELVLGVAGVGAALACLCSLVVLRLVMQRKNSMDRCQAVMNYRHAQAILDNVTQQSENLPSLCFALYVLSARCRHSI